METQPTQYNIVWNNISAALITIMNCELCRSLNHVLVARFSTRNPVLSSIQLASSLWLEQKHCSSAKWLAGMKKVDSNRVVSSRANEINAIIICFIVRVMATLPWSLFAFTFISQKRRDMSDRQRLRLRLRVKQIYIFLIVGQKVLPCEISIVSTLACQKYQRVAFRLVNI